MSACKKRWSLGNPPRLPNKKSGRFRILSPELSPISLSHHESIWFPTHFHTFCWSNQHPKGQKKDHINTWLASSCISACFNWSKRLDVISSSSSWTSETLVLARDTGVDIGINCYICLKAPISFNLLLLIDLSMEILEETSLGLNLHIGHDFSHDHLRISDLHGLKLHRRWPVSQESRIYRPEFFKQGHIWQ